MKKWHYWTTLACSILTCNISQAQVTCNSQLIDGHDPEIGFSNNGLQIYDACLKKFKNAVLEKTKDLIKQDQQKIDELTLAKSNALTKESLLDYSKHYDEETNNEYHKLIQANINERLGLGTKFTKEILIKKDPLSCKNRTLKVHFYKNNQTVFNTINLDDNISMFSTIISDLPGMNFSDTLKITGQTPDLTARTISSKTIGEGVTISADSSSLITQSFRNSGTNLGIPTITLKCS